MAQDKFNKSVCWLRRDLRFYDHASLSHASQNSNSVYVIFNFDPKILNSFKNKKSFFVEFMFQSLTALDESLRKEGSQLIVLYGDPAEEIPKFCNQVGAEALFYNRDYDPAAIQRDLHVDKKVTALGLKTFNFKDHVIFEPHEILKDDGSPYKVFTPYKNAWLKKFTSKSELKTYKINAAALASKANVAKLGLKDYSISDWSVKKLGFVNTPLHDFLPGTNGAKKVFQTFSLSDYKGNRDFPSRERGTSLLSPHIRNGTVSIRHLVSKSILKRDAGHTTWLNELIWREFYQMILFYNPHIVNKNFNSSYDYVKWQKNDVQLKAWQEGQTGYPIIDAGMRQLKSTGWMHNRVRMIVASFLTKDLLIDWREGDAWFREHLIDYDLASNNGGWQWAASTGCDAQPYFRIFNPTLQSEKFDEAGDYIKKYVPELKNFSAKNIHAPWLAEIDEQRKAQCIVGKDYPEPIVDHSVQKIKAIKLFKA
jgi:deoxyribodipyrimidine photo-lyase